MKLNIDLNESEKKYINTKLPDFDSLSDKIVPLNPDLLSIAVGPKSNLPLTSICLNDCLSTLEEAGFALSWAYYYLIILNKTNDEIERISSVTHLKFFSDDVALRLYSSAEHLANALISMFHISDTDLKPFKKKRVSLAVTVGSYLLSKKIDHPISKNIKEIVYSKHWNFTISYRNSWVHNQPPIINGLGFIYKRKSRWTKIKDGGKKYHFLEFGGRDEPDLTYDELITFVTSSLKLIFNLLSLTIKEYRKLLETKGIKFTKKGFEFRK